MAENGEIVAAMIDGEAQSRHIQGAADRVQAATLVERVAQQP
jgi:SOS-response transcriptional repressor LexA